MPPLSKESKDALEKEISELNQSVAENEKKRELLLSDKAAVQEKIDGLDLVINGLKNKKNKIKDDLKGG